MELTKDHLITLEQAGVIPAKTPQKVVELFASICQEKNLSPFSKQIYLTKYEGKNGVKYSTIVGIDGARAIAARTGLHAGTDEVLFDGNLSLAQALKQGVKTPTTATCTVWKIVSGQRVPFTHTVAFAEFKGIGKWHQMPFQMLAKVAESHALKKAFPEEFSGLHSDAEQDQFKSATVVQHEVKRLNEKPKAEQQQIFNDIVATIGGYVSSSELKKDARSILEDAQNNGLSSDLLEQIKQTINMNFVTLKNTEEE